MYIGNLEHEKAEYSSFLGELFQEEKSFGDKVAEDIEAVKEAQKEKGLTKTAKASITVAVIGIGLALGYLAYKKLRKSK